MFVAIEQQSRVPTEASQASRGVGYECGKCEDGVTLVLPKSRRSHFRHKPLSDCSYAGESWQHEEAKGVILDSLRSRGIKAQPECICLSLDGDRRADVLAWAPETEHFAEEDRRRIAFEVQYSSIDQSQLELRTTSYMKQRIPVIWVCVVDQNRLGEMAVESTSNTLRVGGYNAPEWVRQIAAMRGHVWIYVPKISKFFKGWLLPNRRWIESKTWYDSDGSERSSGGYWEPYARLRDLFLEGPYDFFDLRLVRIGTTNDKGPADGWRVLLDLVAPGKTKNQPRPVEQRNVPHMVNGFDTGFSVWEEWIQFEGKWMRAQFNSPKTS